MSPLRASLIVTACSIHKLRKHAHRHHLYRYVQVQNVTSLAARKSMGQSNSIIDSILEEAGQSGGNVTGEHVVYLELGVDWTSFRSKVNKRGACCVS